MYLDESTRGWDRSLPRIPRLSWTGHIPSAATLWLSDKRPSFLQLAVFCTMLMLLPLPSSYKPEKTDSHSTTTVALKHFHHWRKETQFASDLQAQSVVDPSDCTGTSGCALISSSCIYKRRNGVSEESSSSPSDN